MRVRALLGACPCYPLAGICGGDLATHAANADQTRLRAQKSGDLSKIASHVGFARARARLRACKRPRGVLARELPCGVAGDQHARVLLRGIGELWLATHKDRRPARSSRDAGRAHDVGCHKRHKRSVLCLSRPASRRRARTAVAGGLASAAPGRAAPRPPRRPRAARRGAASFDAGMSAPMFTTAATGGTGPDPDGSWQYLDAHGTIQGLYSAQTLLAWHAAHSFFNNDIKARAACCPPCPATAPRPPRARALARPRAARGPQRRTNEAGTGRHLRIFLIACQFLPTTPGRARVCVLLDVAAGSPGRQRR